MAPKVQPKPSEPAKRPREEQAQPTGNAATTSQPKAPSSPPPKGPATPSKGGGDKTVEASPFKRAKHVEPSFNVNNFLVKQHEGKRLHDIISLKPSALQGISEKIDIMLQEYQVNSILDLAGWQPYLLAKALVILKDGEEPGKRAEGCKMNLHRALETAHEGKELNEIVKLPVSALVCLGKKADEDFKPFGIHTIGALGEWKYAKWAEALVTLSVYEG
eukprot:Sspe_Gene.11329::Locus_3825_Transcript_1_1_Confidence_1.000_Length_822::g.11329::m.11329